jgi:hypothetical protein
LPTCFEQRVTYLVIDISNHELESTFLEYIPYYMVTGQKPNLTNLKVFGCRAYVLILPTPSKFERLLYGVCKGLVPSKDGGVSKIIISRHVTFDEGEQPSLKDMDDIMYGDGASDSSYACK